MASPFVALSDELVSLCGRVSPSVVAVEGRARGYSSGVHWRSGLFVTADHTLHRDEDIGVVLPDGARRQATLVGRDPGTDIALVKAESHDLAALTPGPETEARVGELIVVVGRSPNSGPNMSFGMIGGVSGPWRTWRGGQLDTYIRLDATIFSGSSGGAVVDCRGNVVGMATSALSRVAGLVVPSSTIHRVVDQLLEQGSVPHGYLGISLQAVRLPGSLQKKTSAGSGRALIIYDVEQDGPAEKAGILIGDLLLEVEGKPISAVEDLQALLGWDRVGKPVRTKIIRGGEIRDLTLVVGKRKREEEQ